MMTQPRKKIFNDSPIGAGAKTDHKRPAARKPLYNPWLAAKVALLFANSASFLKVFMPNGFVHINISR